MFLNSIDSFVYNRKENYKRLFDALAKNLDPGGFERKISYTEWLERYQSENKGRSRESTATLLSCDPAEYGRLMKQSKCMISGISQAKLSSGAGLRYSLLPTLQPGAQSYTPLSWSLCWNNDLNSTLLPRNQQNSDSDANIIHGYHHLLNALLFKKSHSN